MAYIHGFDEVEQERLVAQAKILENKIFEKIDFSERKNILEIGCGVGAQTEILINKFPNSHITGVELNDIQLVTANAYLNSKYDSSQFDLYQMDASNLSFEDNSFDAIYICWVLEHVSNPQKIVDECYRVLKKGGVISISEVQNNNLHIVPNSSFILDYWSKYNTIQLELGGNPYVGVEIGNFIFNAGFNEIINLSRNFLLDNNYPTERETMVNYWTNLLLSGFDELLKNNKVIASDRKKIKSELSKIKKNNGVFHYSFIQAQGVK